jgi:4-amino-4-deoxy-L-arabinose transferase-like glycosyltransferase
VGLLSRIRPELAGLMALAGLLNVWALDRNGWANDYYSAAVRSMASSWHAFLYGSFDAAGVMTVDKPPLALWVQAASVRVFGFHPLSILLPEALMGVATVALVYDLVRRRFGRAAGFAAGLALATTPITVAISRHNNPDALLILCCTAALWFAVRAFEDGRTRWLVAAGVCVGLGFEAKMAVALMVVPAIAVAWLWVAPRGRAAAVRQLLAGGAAMTVVGGAWPLLVWLTPASQRPWVSGTSDNSIWSLILDYNGFGRLDGQAGGPQAFGGGGGAGGAGGAGGPFGGPASVVRLLDASLGGQAGWLLGFALVGGLGILAVSRLRRTDARTGWLLAVGGSALTSAVAFSAAKGIFHPYYVSFLAPFSAALVGGGVGLLRERGNLARGFLAAALIAGVVTEIAVLRHNPGQLTWLPGLLAAAVTLAALGLLVAHDARLRALAVAAGLAFLLIAPSTWAVQTLGHATSGTFPAGGPATVAAGGFGGGPPGAGRFGGGGGGFAGGGPGGDALSTSVLQYVARHGGGTIAVSSQTGASGAIIQSGANVAGIGGFSGRESEVSVSWLADAVRAGTIRWVVADSGGGFGPGRDARVGSSEVMAAVTKACTPVSASSSLYDCSGRAGALAAAG